MPHFYRIIVFLLLLPAAAPTTAQPTYAPCGVVDAFEYPIDISDTLERGYDDFALYRARFGGIHVGVDIGFERLGEPVVAAARGRVTYADPEGWDTEKGVVIVEHSLPDGSTAYTLYGHMEETEDVFFPIVNQCVEQGDVVGTIGWPSRGLPHLHYEIRSFMPGDGGPGYVPGNPTLAGWYHPFDFTELWRLRLSPAYIGSITFNSAPSLPPIILDSGVFVTASSNTLEGYIVPDRSLWRSTTDGVITGLVGLPGDRVVARTRSGQMVMLQGGRYSAVWTVSGPDAPLVAIGESLIVLTDGGGVSSYTAAGDRLWHVPPQTTVVSADADDIPPRAVSFQSSGSEVAAAVRVGNDYYWRLIDSSGQLVYETVFRRSPVVASIPSGGWLVLDGSTLYRVNNSVREELATIRPTPGRWARMAADVMGNIYLYVGDPSAALLALDPSGEVRWRADYPVPVDVLPPLVSVGGGCLLYTLDRDGTLNVFSTLDGERVSQRQIYAGGDRNGSPQARLLQADEFDRVLVGGGFLTVTALDGAALAPDVISACRAGG